MTDASGTIWRGTTPTVTVTLPLDLEGDRITIAKVDGGWTITAN